MNITFPACEEMEYPACFTPSESVPGLDETLVLGVLLEVRDLVALPVVESVGPGVAGDDDVGPIAAPLEQNVVTYLK